MERKYQVFVSSTYEDLRKERQEVIHALLELDCIPSGMELFPAADEDQWSLITGVIDQCDYYLLILGGRYGSTGADGVGYTEMEYQYALEMGKPIIAFLHKEPDSLPKKNTEQSEKGQKKLQEFRKLAQQKMCKYWNTPAELGSVVSRSLIMLQKKHPGVGWVRGNLVPEKEVTSEILSLRHEIERLENELRKSKTEAPKGTEGLAQGKDKTDVFFKFEAERKDNYDTYTLTNSIEKSWNDIFYTISPLMINEASDLDIKLRLDQFVKEWGMSEIVHSKKYQEYEDFGRFEIDKEDFETIIVQLRALGLITQSNKNRSVKDTSTYWSLTPYGDNIMVRLRAIQKLEKENNG